MATPMLPLAARSIKGEMVKSIRLSPKQVSFLIDEVLDQCLAEPRLSKETLHGQALIDYEDALLVEERYSVGTLRFELNEKSILMRIGQLIVRRQEVFFRHIELGISDVRAGAEADRWKKEVKDLLRQLQVAAGGMTA